MLELKRIEEMFEDTAVQAKGLSFLNWILTELGQDKTLNAQQKMDYLEMLLVKSLEVRENLPLKEKEQWEAFEEDYYAFIRCRGLVGTPASNGKIPLHFISGFDGAVLVSGLTQDRIVNLFTYKDNDGHDVFHEKDGFEARVLLDELKPAVRVEFLGQNQHILKPLCGCDISNIIQDFSVAQLNQLFNYRTSENQPPLWEQFSAEVQKDILRYMRRINGVKWKGPNHQDGSQQGYSRG